MKLYYPLFLFRRIILHKSAFCWKKCYQRDCSCWGSLEKSNNTQPNTEEWKIQYSFLYAFSMQCMSVNMFQPRASQFQHIEQVCYRCSMDVFEILISVALHRVLESEEVEVDKTPCSPSRPLYHTVPCILLPCMCPIVGRSGHHTQAVKCFPICIIFSNAVHSRCISCFSSRDD